MSTRTTAKRLLVQGDRFWPRRPGVTVLIYHRVGGGSNSEVDLDVAAFRRQLEHLAEHHRVVPIDAVADLVAADHDRTPTADDHHVVITFDDGTSDFVDEVVPALVDHDLPATLYVATDFIDRQDDFPWGAPPATWAGLREAVTTGLVTIGSHTHTHALLDRVEPATIADELDRSIDLIGEHLDGAPRHFAYPKALPGSIAAEAEVRRRFITAALARSRVNEPGSTDLHRLWRTPIQRSDGFDFFVAKADGGLRLEGELRELAARVKYRRSTA